jgi:6-phosphogluconolactonase
MPRPFRLTLPLLCALIAALVSFTNAIAQDVPTFVYTNEDVNGPNTISAFRADSAGSLTAVAGSPFSTSGSGGANGAYAAPKIVIAGKFLYASNSASSNVSGFAINTTTGVLTPVPGSPFATSLPQNWMTLAATPNGAFVIAAMNENSNLIEVFSVNRSTGALTKVPGSPFSFPSGGCATAMKVSPDSKYLYSACWFGNGTVTAFSIASNGVLTNVQDSPFAGLRPVNVEINCQNSLLFAPANGSDTEINVFAIGAGGALSPISGSPFIVHPNSRGEGLVLDPSDKFLFVSNFADSVTVLNVAANGSLSAVPGSPFKIFGNGIPAGLGVPRKSNFLYVANTNKLISALSVSSVGALSPVLASPFLTGNAAAHAESVALYPPKRCGVD